jgi:hypothetical protein
MFIVHTFLDTFVDLLDKFHIFWLLSPANIYVWVSMCIDFLLAIFSC